MDESLCKLFLPNYRLFRHKDTGRVSRRFVDVLKGVDRLTVDPDYVSRGRGNTLYGQAPSNWPKTLFKEVEMAQYSKLAKGLMKKRKEFANYLAIREPPSPIDGMQFAGILIDALELIIERNWSRNESHVMLCSSGYDSRLLAKLLYRIYQRRGDCWLGDFRFLCVEAECNAASRILAHIGWAPSRLTILNDGLPPGEYLRDALDFKQMWRRLNCPVLFPFGWFYWPIEVLQREGLLPDSDDKIQGWAAYWGNTVPLLAELRPFQLESRTYEWESSMQLEKVEVILPLRSLLFLTLLARLRPSQGTQPMRMALLKRLDPELVELERCPREQCRAYWTLSREAFKEIIDQYWSSWYGRRVHPGIIGFATRCALRPHDWWSRYTAASLTEHLIKEGYKLELI